jgi:hypothetical protein
MDEVGLGFISSKSGNVSRVATEKLNSTESTKMPEERNPDQLVADSMSKLFGSMGAAVANPMAATGAKAISGKFRITGVITREDGSPVANVSVGMMGVEVRTDEQGRFVMVVEKK